MSLLGSILGGGVQAVAFDDLLDDLKTHRGEVQDRLVGENPTLHPGGITGEVKETGGFTPWGVSTRGLGDRSFGADGQMSGGLSDPMQTYSDAMRQNAMNSASMGTTMDPQMRQQAMDYYGGSNMAMNNAMGMDTGARETEVYNRMRAMQQPEEMRQMESMQANLFGTGRGGMVTDAYGGSPEEFAFNKARAEAMNQASLGAMGQAQTEMMNQGQLSQNFGNLGTGAYQAGLQEQQIGGQMSGMFNDAMMSPYAQNLSEGQLALQGGQLQNQQNQQLASLLSQLGIGGLTTDVNYANVIGGVYGKMAEAAGTAATATGDWLSDNLFN